MSDKFLDRYSGQSVDELLALSKEYRIDSIVLAFEQALLQGPGELVLAEYHEAELAILAVESLEREVNNGGYHQFFLNTPEYAEHIVGALRRIDCPETAKLTQKAIDLLRLPGPPTTSNVTEVLQADAERKLVDILDRECDDPYYAGTEPIADRLLAYIAANRKHIRIPQT